MRYKVLDILAKLIKIEDLSYLICKKMMKEKIRSVDVEGGSKRISIRGRIVAFGMKK